MSWVVGDSAFEEAAFDATNLPLPDLALRVAFTAGQQIAYGGQTRLKRGKRDFYHRMFLREANRFSTHFRDKVEYIFYLRPAPVDIVLKRSTRENLYKKIDPSKIIKATKQDEEKLQGIKLLFDETSSSDSE